MLDDQDFRDERAEVTMASPAAHLLDELQLHGYRPLEEEGDPNPLPSPEAAELALATIFEAAIGLFAETRLEPDLPDLLWSLVNLFHRQTERMGRLLDDNEIAQRNSQGQQDGSEVRVMIPREDAGNYESKCVESGQGQLFGLNLVTDGHYT